jgi:branched-chain amino acid transport system ATP-binding protein
MALLEVRGIQVAYGHIKAVRDVSFDVPAASIVALIGSNGAGKTTTMRAITNLTPVSGGEIRFEGQRIDGLRPSETVSKGIALSPEGRRLFPRMTVLENLLIGAHRVADHAAIQRTLESIYAYFPTLKERRRQQAGSLSGGEQQMAAIGRALMARPQLLLFDEPSLGLAPKMVQEIARIITQINKEAGLSILLVEQNAQMALRLCHAAYVIEQGSIVLSGSGQDLLASDFVRKAYLGV